MRPPLIAAARTPSQDFDGLCTCTAPVVIDVTDRLVEKLFDMHLRPNMTAYLVNQTASPAVFPAPIQFSPSYSSVCGAGLRWFGCVEQNMATTGSPNYACSCDPVTPDIFADVTTSRTTEIILDTVLGPTIALAAAFAASEFAPSASPTPAPSYAAAAAGLGGAVAFLVLVLIALILYILALKGQLKYCGKACACCPTGALNKILPRSASTNTKMGSDWARSPQRLKTSALDLPSPSPLGIALQAVPSQPPPPASAEL